MRRTRALLTWQSLTEAKRAKTAYYMLRWVRTRGEAGPSSQTVSGTITN